MAIQSPTTRLVSAGWYALFVLAALGLARACWLSLTRGGVSLWVMMLAWAIPTVLLATILVFKTPGWSLFRMVTLGIIFAAVTTLTDWPFRLAVIVSRPAMDRVALESTSPRRIGLFPILATQRLTVDAGSVVAFWTDLDPAGRSGLVYSPSGALPFNVGREQSIAPGWFFVVED